MLDRTLAPLFNRSTSFDLIHPDKYTVANGAEAYFVVGGTQDVCKVEIIFPAGRWHEKIWGVSYFTSQLISKGTAGKNSYTIASIFDQYGAHLEINPAMDSVSISLYSLTKNLEPSLALLLEILTESIFPQKEFDQTRAVYFQNQKVNREKTSYQASTLIRKKIYGTSFPYGKELEDAEVNDLTQKNLLDYFNAYFKSATILVSGKVSDAHKQLILDTVAPFTFADLKYNAPVYEAESKHERQHVGKEGSVQATIRMGKKSIGRSHNDYADVIFLNHILGGYFGSRLMKNIREDKGLSYGISSGLHTLIHGNHLIIGADVNLENLEITFDEIKKELKRLRTDRIGSEELETSRNHFIGSLQSEITTSFAHADKIRNILLFDLPSDFYQKMIARLDKVTADDLLRTADTYFREDGFIEVAVG